MPSEAGAAAMPCEAVRLANVLQFGARSTLTIHPKVHMRALPRALRRSQRVPMARPLQPRTAMDLGPLGARPAAAQAPVGRLPSFRFEGLLRAPGAPERSRLDRVAIAPPVPGAAALPGLLPIPKPLPAPAAPDVSRIARYMRAHTVDAHLTLVQVCRVCLTGFGFVGFVAAVGFQGPGSEQRLRLQCAATSGACFISSLYYTRLYALRRLPLSMGYSLESNTVAESLRYSTWSVSVSLLSLTAFLLRGPFQGSETWGPLGPEGGWQWTYAGWAFGGPLLSCLGTLVGLPGWHASRTARAKIAVGQYRAAAGWVVACFIFLSVSTAVTLTTGSAMLQPAVPEQRTSQEVALARTISALWFVYPAVSLLRTLALMCGAGDWSEETEASVRRAEAARAKRELLSQQRQRTRRFEALRRWASKGTGARLFGAARAAGTAVAGALGSVLEASFLALVAAPEPRSAVAVARVAALADGVASGLPVSVLVGSHEEDARGPVAEMQRLLPRSDLKRVQQDPLDALEMRMHQPEVTPLCSQAIDSIISLVDIFSQGVAALGCAFITLRLDATVAPVASGAGL